ncbi:accessory gene regulator B family protein [Cohnella algarum]|uniref:accessory gene regulator B family protein n=1 Tax=Cohnella algarum TaxID=2044859 RepID=UPI0019682E95|nr:accessory gene regulator B family protein [Cohnella algarum]MBN2981883.1 accessory gene regulator B family protein [Cohnella algarum]
MIDRLAERFALRLMGWGELGKDAYPRLRLGLIISLTTLLIVGFTVFILAWTDRAGEGVLSLVSLAALRYFSGGMHFRTSEQCVAVTVAIAVLCAMLPDLSVPVTIVCHGACVVLLAIFSPSGALRQKLPAGKHARYRWISIALAALGTGLTWSAVTYSILFQSISTIKIKK